MSTKTVKPAETLIFCGGFVPKMCPKMVAFTAQKMGSNPLWPNPMWLKDPEDLHQNQLQDHQNHPQDHQNRLQGLQNPTYKEPPQGGAAYW